MTGIGSHETALASPTDRSRPESMPLRRSAWREPRAARRVAPALAMLGLALAPGPPAVGQEPAPVEVRGDSVVLDFQNADIELVFGALAELAGLTVVHGALPDRPVTLRSPRPVARTALRRMLQSIADANGLSALEEDGIIRILPASGARGAGGGDEARRAQSAPAAAESPVRLFVHRLNHANAETLAGTVRALFGLGSVDGAASGRADTSPESSMVVGAAADPDTPTAAEPVRDTAGPVPGGLAGTLEARVQLVADGLTNSLLVRATPADYATIQAAVEELDARPLQVLIEVVVAEVRRDERGDLGVDISVPDQRDSETDVILGGEMEGRSAGDVALRILDIGAVGADVTLRALAATGNVSILSRPVVITQNNQEARLLVGSERPFVQLFRSLPTDDAVRDQVVQYRDVGTQLTIRPSINPDGYVTLTVLQEVSSATAETQFGAPVISTREVETQLLVKDRQTAVLGGIVGRQEERSESGIPILKDIPLIGGLFGSSQQRTGVTELFLLLTPHVIRTDGELDSATRRFQGRVEHVGEQTRHIQPLVQPSDTTDSISGQAP